MLDLIREIFQAIYEARDESRLTHASIHGYKAAWRERRHSGDTRPDLLLTAIAGHGSGGVLQAPYTPDVQAALCAWEGGMSPKEARTAIRAASD